LLHFVLLYFQNHQKNNLKVAENLYKEVLNVNPNHVNAHINLGVIFSAFREFQKAINSYQNAIQINPNHVDALNNLGNSLKELGEYKKAISSYQKAIEIQPDYANAHNNLGLAFQKLGELQKARNCYEKAIQIHLNYANAHNNLGIVFNELREHKKAIGYYEKAIQIDPNYAAAYNNLGKILGELNHVNEAKKYFNNDEVYIEKYFNNPRHIEVQILSDKNKTIHLGERDCSVQRRYQKLIEESPSPILNEEVRKDLLSKTVKMVENIGYEGAGTVEFIYDSGKFYFLEMNTRIQVEHPVSEVVTGIDIVKEQISIAAKGYTSLNQTDIISRGHAIECRINAEDPEKNFQPSPGIISVCHQPSGFRTRIDGAIFQGCKISPYYDSLICKLICHGRNRTEAIQRTLRSLDEFVIEGVTTTIDLHKKILNHRKFINSS